MESKRKSKTKASALLLVSALFVGLLVKLRGKRRQRRSVQGERLRQRSRGGQ